MVAGQKTIMRLSKTLTGDAQPGKKGVIPTAILGTGVFVTLSALDSTILGNRLQAISISLPLVGNFGIIDAINFAIFFTGKSRVRSAVTAVVGSKLITGAVSIAGLVGGLPGGVAAAGGSSAVAAGSRGAPV